jgi:hypothetical protein
MFDSRELPDMPVFELKPKPVNEYQKEEKGNGQVKSRDQIKMVGLHSKKFKLIPSATECFIE